MKTQSRWYSDRVEQEILLCRWGHYGTPVLVFPTAGGDAEEIERMLMIRALEPLLEAGRVKVYSVDSVAARSWSDPSVPGAHKTWLLNRFAETVRHEVVPAIHADCGRELPIATAGASIGAFNAVAAVCRYPHVFRRAICMSGSYDVERFMKGLDGPDTDLYFASPLHFLPRLEDDAQIEALRAAFVVMAHGGGPWEDPQQDWRLAALLGSKGVPNRVDPWGEGYDHDWPTWRAMLPKYLGELDLPAA